MHFTIQNIMIRPAFYYGVYLSAVGPRTIVRNIVLNMLIFALKETGIRQYEYRHPPLIHLIRGKEWQLKKLQRVYSLHLYESSWGKDYLCKITPESIFDPENAKYESNFSKLMRTVLQEPPWEQSICGCN